MSDFSHFAPRVDTLKNCHICFGVLSHVEIDHDISASRCRSQVLGFSFTSQQILKSTKEFTSGPFPKKPTEHRSASFPPGSRELFNPLAPLFLPQNQLATVEVRCSPKYFDPSEGQGKTLPRIVCIVDWKG